MRMYKQCHAHALRFVMFGKGYLGFTISTLRFISQWHHFWRNWIDFVLTDYDDDNNDDNTNYDINITTSIMIIIITIVIVVTTTAIILMTVTMMTITITIAAIIIHNYSYKTNDNETKLGPSKFFIGYIVWSFMTPRPPAIYNQSSLDVLHRVITLCFLDR